MSTGFETLDFFTMPAFLHGAPALAIAFIGAILCAISPYIFRKDLVDSEGHSIPPGPLFRYAFLRKYPERALQAWARKYGPLFSIWMGNQLFVVVSDPVIAKDLLVTNGAIFSGRNPYFIKNRTVLNGRSITASGHDDHWRRDRRIAMSIMTLKAIQGYAHVIDFEAHVLVQSLYRKTNSGIVPINPGDFCGRFALNNMLTISYATRTDSTEDALTERALAITTEFAEISGVWSNMVDFIEILQYIPSRKRARARALHDSIIEVYGAMIERVRARLDRGDDVPDCLVKTLIQTQDKENLDWEDACMLAAVFTLGGVHTTAGLLRWVIALMAEHPDIQRRAHAELDAVVGSETRPSAADEQRLPYIRAIIKECERVHPPFLMITPHKADQNFVYNGVFIPKDTTIIADVWAMHHDEKRYPEPFKFNPDRYLGDELSSAQSALLSNPMERDHWSFGAGRRFCPGVHVAEHSIFVAVANLLWAFKIESVPGQPLSFDEYDGRSGHTPLPYRVFFRPRHDDVSTLLGAEDDEKTLSVRA